MKKVLLTGATGMLGRAFLENSTGDLEVLAMCRSAESKSKIEFDTNVEWFEGDLFNIEFLEEVVSQVDVVIHSAGLVSYQPSDKYELYRVNVEGTRNLVNACIDKKVKLVHISSVAALGRNRDDDIVDEEKKWSESSLNTNYAISKYHAELEVWRGSEEGLEVVVLSPSVILGKGIHLDESSASVFKQVLYHSKFYTAGNMNYVDVRDVCDVIKAVIRSSFKNERLIVSADSISVKTFMEHAAKLFNVEKPSMKVGRVGLKVMSIVQRVLRMFGGRKPSITSESIKIAQLNVHYSNDKLKSKTGFQFRKLDETLKWLAPYYVEKYK